MELGKLDNFSNEMLLLVNNFQLHRKNVYKDLKVVENLIEL